MRKILILLSLCLGLMASVVAADTLTLSDGSSVTGDIVKSDDNGMMIHASDDTYKTVQWAKFSQDSLKQLAKNPKLQAYVEPFILPTESQRAAKPQIKVRPVTRMARPEHSSIFGGLVHSSLGWFILLVIYAANLYAAFEIAIVRGKPFGVVIGLSAILPVIGPIIFLAQPPQQEPAPDQIPGESVTPISAPGATGAPQDEVQIVASSWQGSSEEAKPQPQIFARGKFTFNKRFIETKFAGFLGEPKGDAKNFSMELRTLKGLFAVERIMQIGPTEGIFETANGQVTVPFADIQEIKLNPKTA